MAWDVTDNLAVSSQESRAALLRFLNGTFTKFQHNYMAATPYTAIRSPLLLRAFILEQTHVGSQ